VTEVIVSTTELSKSFGAVQALAPLDLEIYRGEVLGCLGPNGAGKTTLIRLLLGLSRPTSGHATIFGLDATREAARVHARTAYVPGEASLWPSLTGAQTLELLANLHGDADLAYRDELVDVFKLDVRKRVRAYSKGNRQKLALIGALMTRADLLLLDEPTSGLDPLMEEVFRQCVRQARERGQTVLLSSHILSEVEALCDRVAILRNGVLADLNTLAHMRHLSALDVELTFAGPVPDLGDIAGVSAVETIDPHSVRLRLRGSVQPLLAALAEHQVTRLLSREPSLEELFLAHYGDEGPAPARAPMPTLAGSDAR